MVKYCMLVEHPSTKPGDMYWSDNDTKKNPDMPKQSLLVVLPNGLIFDFENAKKHGWEITGEAPYITVGSSIYSDRGGPKSWHGYLKNGEFISA